MSHPTKTLETLTRWSPYSLIATLMRTVLVPPYGQALFLVLHKCELKECTFQDYVSSLKQNGLTRFRTCFMINENETTKALLTVSINFAKFYGAANDSTLRI